MSLGFDKEIRINIRRVPIMEVSVALTLDLTKQDIKKSERRRLLYVLSVNRMFNYLESSCVKRYEMEKEISYI